MDDGVWQDFGQKVSLCARIREILINYPEGTSILKELLQNADDAAATEVKFCIDLRTHSSGSLVAPALAPFQGPALLAYNNAVFSEADFESISRIGDSVKRGAAGKTGRFGVGFNSVYHVTDVPSFVSGQHLVMFDPHCSYLPNISSANPGKKLNFVTHNIQSRYVDQCEPYRVFGCDMVHPFSGTLFRFPLRTKDMASRSLISKQVYAPEDVQAWLHMLKDEAAIMMLFLKHVEHMQVYEWDEGALSPRLLFQCGIIDADAAVRKARSRFLDVAKAFAMAQEQGERDRRTEGLIQQRAIGETSYSVTFQMDEGKGDQGPHLHQYLIVQGVGDDDASALARHATEQFGVTVLPWAAVAARIGSSSSGSTPQDGAVDGLAFCTLPLPVHTQLPVHVNGYFELSTNRRDIWYGQDMTGLGRLRSEWNVCLLNNVAAPCYARLLIESARLLGPGAQFAALWPGVRPTSPPWTALVEQTYRFLTVASVVPSRGPRGPYWVTPETAVYPDELVLRVTGLTDALFAAGMPLSTLPAAVNRQLIALAAGPRPRLLHPGLVRQHLRGAQDIVSARLQIAEAVELLRYCLEDIVDDDVETVTQQLTGLPFIPMRDGRLTALQPQGRANSASSASAPCPCMMLITADQEQLLEKLPELVVDASALGSELIGRLQTMASLQCLTLQPLTTTTLMHHVFPKLLPQSVRSSEAVRLSVLLSESPGGDEGGSGAPRGPLDRAWLQCLWRVLVTLGELNALTDVWCLLPTTDEYLVPLQSKVRSSPLRPGLPADVAAAAQKLHIRQADDNIIPVDHPSILPYLPSGDGAGLMQAITALLTSHDATVQPSMQPPPGGLPSQYPLGNHALAGRTNGHNSFLQLVQQLSTDERSCLRRYLLQRRWLQLVQETNRRTDGPMHPPSIVAHALKQLAIFETARSVAARQSTTDTSADGRMDETGQESNSVLSKDSTMTTEQEPEFVDLTSQRLLVPKGVPAEALGPLFIAASTDEQRAILTSFLGVQQIGTGECYRSYVLPTLPDMKPFISLMVATQLLQQLPVLLQEDASLAVTLATTAFVPTRNGTKSCPGQLYDPRLPELKQLLDPASSFPAAPFDTDGMLSALSLLGLRRSVRPDTLLAAARHVQEMAAEDPAAAVVKGRKLLNYLEVESNRLFGTHVPSSLTAPTANSISLLLGKLTRGAAKTLQQGKSLRDGYGAGTGFGGQDRRTDATEGGPGGPSEEEVREEQFWSQLRMLEWCPVVLEPPLVGLPWATARGVVGPPRAMRPYNDAWLVSGTLQLLDGECRSAHLADKLGWTTPVPVSVLATQLQMLGEKHSMVEDAQLRQQLAVIVPQLYGRLSGVNPDDAELCRQLLQDAAVVWVGSGFARTSKVAFSGPLNLAPWLFVLPADLAPFHSLLRDLGVQHTFAPATYVDVLHVMEDQSNKRPLPSETLTQALSIIQELSDKMDSTDASLPVPDSQGVLHPAGDLVFDDAPWLEGAAATTGPIVHPRLSHEVAERVGVASLRRRLLARTADTLQLGLADGQTGNLGVEAFGQSEALTTRIRHIIDAYADGPGVLLELVQNADDAGATEVAFLLDDTQYPTNSILGPSMAPWQGPALLAWNDAEFAPKDFAAISKIGQDSKTGQPGATGRFGLGFNAVYHFTDLPSFVSGAYLVMFDPHAAYLPGVSPAQPGLKIAFQKAALLNQFPDAFAPYLQFGCTLAQPYKGSLFRFPLRDSVTAARSDIKGAPYPVPAVMALFQAFGTDMVAPLLFLKSVRSIKLYYRRGMDARPRLLYGCEAQAQNGVSPQAGIRQFVGQDNRDGMRRAMTTRQEQLPRSCTTVTFLVSTTDEERPAVSQSAVKQQQQQWLVCNALSGGAAQQLLAASSRLQARGLLPWVGLACRIGGAEGDMESTDGEFKGRAFCFLPLPAATALPVHVNAYFELSSNRRDVWFGEDMSGDGQLRSQWNAALLRDALAREYLDLLLAARKAVGSGARYWALWPRPGACSGPWRVLAEAVYQHLGTHPLLWSSTLGGLWVSTKTAVLSTDTTALQGLLAQALVTDGFPLVTDAPTDVVAAILASNSHARQLCPSLVRAHFSDKTAAHPLLDGQTDADGARRLISVQVPERIETASEPVQDERALDGRTDGLRAVLEYCLSDVQTDVAEKTTQSVMQLVGLLILPLEGGLLGEIRPATDRRAPTYFIAEGTQANLLQHAMQGQLIDVSLASSLGKRLRAIAATRALNITTLGAAQLAEKVLPQLLGEEWRVASRQWLPGQTGHPSPELLRDLWQFLAALCDLSPLTGWALLPVHARMDGVAPSMGVVQANMRVAETADESPVSRALWEIQKPAQVIVSGGWTEEVDSALLTLGCGLWDASVLGPPPSPLTREGYVMPSTAWGLLQAVRPSVETGDLSGRAERLTDSQRDQLRAYLLQGKWFAPNPSDGQTLDDACIQTLRALPVYLTPGAPEGAPRGSDRDFVPPRNRYTALTAGQQYWLIPDGIPQSALSQHFIVTNSVEALLLRNVLGVVPCTRLQYVQQHMEQLLQQLPAAARQDVALALLRDIADATPSYTDGKMEADDDMLDALSKVSFVDTDSGELKRVDQLYDPRNAALRMLLDPDRDLPSKRIAADIKALSVLVEMGLRCDAGPGALLDVARGIEAAAAAIANAPVEDVQCGAELAEGRATALLQQLNTLAQSGAVGPTMTSFWASIRVVTCLPVMTQPPSTHLPWPQEGPSGGPWVPIAAPDSVRPVSQAWTVSASLRLLRGVASEQLANALGWHSSPPPNVLAVQLKELGLKHREPLPSSEDAELRLQLLQAASELYNQLRPWVTPPTPMRVPGSEAGELGLRRSGESGIHPREGRMAMLPPEGRGVLLMLAGGPVAWVGDSFTTASSVALHSPADFRPYLWTTPIELSPFRDVLMALGVQQTFTAAQYADALKRMARESGSQALDVERLEMALQMVSALHDQLTSANKRPEGTLGMHDDRDGSRTSGTEIRDVWLPDAQGFMTRATQLYYNDATWLADVGVRMAHPDVPTAAAKELGCLSLRYHHTVDTTLMHVLACPGPPTIREALQGRDTPLSAVVTDVMQVADACGAPTLEVYLDMQHYPDQQLLHPALAPLQGPALCFKLQGVTLATEELAMLLSDGFGTPVLHGRTCHGGQGLLPLFLVTDVPMILTGDALHIWDPIGATLQDGQTAGQPTAKLYHVVGNDLTARFKDQFSVWRFAGGSPFTGGSNDTLIRLPLRRGGDLVVDETRQKQAQKPVPKQAAHATGTLMPAPPPLHDLQVLLTTWASKLAQSMLFMRSLRNFRLVKLSEAKGEDDRVPAQAQAPTGSPLCITDRLFDSSLMPHAGVPRAPIDAREWKARNTGLMAFGRKLVSSSHVRHEGARRLMPCDLITRAGSDTKVQSWLVSSCAGVGGAKELATDRGTAEALGLDPWAAVAVQLPAAAVASTAAKQDASPVVQLSGLFGPFPLDLPAHAPSGDVEMESDMTIRCQGLNELPFLVAGHFCLAPGRALVLPDMDERELVPETRPQYAVGQPQSIPVRFNKELLLCVALAWLEALRRIRDDARAARGPSGGPLGPAKGPQVYSMFPTLPTVPAGHQGTWMALELVTRICHQSVQSSVWLLRAGGWVGIADGCFLQPSPTGVGALALSFIQQQLPVFDIPWRVKMALESTGVTSIQEVSPSTVRKLLKKLYRQKEALSSLNPHEALQLLAYCLGDAILPVQESATSELAPAARPVAAVAAADAPPPAPAVSADTVANIAQGLGIHPSVVDAATTNMQGLLNNADEFVTRMLLGTGAADAPGDSHGAPQTGAPAGLAERFTLPGALAGPTAGQLLQQVYASAANSLQPTAAMPAPDPISQTVLRDCLGLPVPNGNGDIIPLGQKQLFSWPANLTPNPLVVLPNTPWRSIRPSLTTPAFAGVYRGAAGPTQAPLWSGFLFPPAVQELETYLQYGALRQTLQLPRYTLKDLAHHLRAVEGLVRTPQGPMRALQTAAWADGRQGGPSYHWVHEVWEVVLQLARQDDTTDGRTDRPSLGQESPVWDTLNEYQLLPITTGQLVPVSSRRLVHCLPTPVTTPVGDTSAADPPGAVADESPGHVPVEAVDEHSSLPWLLPWLHKVGAWVLDGRFTGCRAVVTPLSPSQGAPEGPVQLEAVVVGKLSEAAQLGGVQFGDLDDEEKTQFLDWLGAAGAQAIHSESDKQFLLQLPLFPSLAGHTVPAAFGRTGAVAVTQEAVVELVGSLDGLPDAMKDTLLAYKPETAALYAGLGIATPSKAELMHSVMLQQYSTLQSEAQKHLLDFVLSNWHSLQRDERLLDALGQTPFVETGAPGGLMCPRDLYDPENQLLQRVFGNEPKFPIGVFASRQWLAVLRKSGLKADINADTFLECARELNRQAAEWGTENVLPEDRANAWSTACLLTQQLQRVTDMTIVAELKTLCFLPAIQGIPGATWSQKVLAAPGRCLHPRDWKLAWAAVPVLSEEALPPSTLMTPLGVRSPPVYETIASHLQQVGDRANEALLWAWPPSAGAPEEVFRAPLAHLQAQGASAARLGTLAGSPCVPVANCTQLAPPERLFTRLQHDLAPFAYELPASFLSVTEVLTAMGMRGSPTADDLVTMLTDIKQLMDGMGRPLHSNELRATVSILTLMATEGPLKGPGPGPLTSIRGAASLQSRQTLKDGAECCVYAPGLDGRMYDVRQCVCGHQAPARLLHRLDTAAVVLLHPLVPPEVRGPLGVPLLHQVITETLDTSAPLRLLDAIQGVQLTAMQQLVASPEFTAATADLLRETSSGLPSHLSDSLSVQTLGPRLIDVSQRLRFVEECRTRLVSVQSKRDVTRGGESVKVYEFVDGASGGAVYVAEPPMRVPVVSLLARVISRALGVPFGLPLEPLLTAGTPSSIRTVQSVLLSTEQPASGMMSATSVIPASTALAVAEAAGKLGCRVLDSDASAMVLRPLRSYAKGELVAYTVKVSATGAAAAAAAARNRMTGLQDQGLALGPPLQYGRVTRDAQAPAGAPLYRVPVEVQPGVVQDLLSIELYSFGSNFQGSTAAHLGGAQMTPNPSPADEGYKARLANANGDASLAQLAAPNDSNRAKTSSAEAEVEMHVQGIDAPAISAPTLTPQNRGYQLVANSVSGQDVVNAVRDVLGAVGLSLDVSAGPLMEQVVDLRVQLDVVQKRMSDAMQQAEQHQAEAERVRSNWNCRICLTNEVDAVMTACGHALCYQCGRSAAGRSARCPFCRTNSSLTRLYK